MSGGSRVKKVSFFRPRIRPRRGIHGSQDRSSSSQSLGPCVRSNNTWAYPLFFSPFIHSYTHSRSIPAMWISLFAHPEKNIIGTTFECFQHKRLKTCTKAIDGDSITMTQTLFYYGDYKTFWLDAFYKNLDKSKRKDRANEKRERIRQRNVILSLLQSSEKSSEQNVNSDSKVSANTRLGDRSQSGLLISFGDQMPFFQVPTSVN